LDVKLTNSYLGYEEVYRSTAIQIYIDLGGISPQSIDNINLLVLTLVVSSLFRSLSYTAFIGS